MGADAKPPPKKGGKKKKKEKEPPPQLSEAEILQKQKEEREKLERRGGIIAADLRKFLDLQMKAKADYKLQGEAWFTMLDKMEKRKMPAPVLSGAIWYAVGSLLLPSELRYLTAIVKSVHPKKVFMKPFVLNENLVVIKHNITQAACAADHHEVHPLVQSKMSATPKQMRLEGVTCEELFKYGCNSKELVQAGYSPKQIIRACSAGVELRTILKGLRSAGLTPKDIKDNGGEHLLKALPLKTAGYSAFEIKSAGCISAADMKGVGFSKAALADAGYSNKELLDAGFSGRLYSRAVAVKDFIRMHAVTHSAFAKAQEQKAAAHKAAAQPQQDSGGGESESQYGGGGGSDAPGSLGGGGGDDLKKPASGAAGGGEEEVAAP